MNINEPVSLVNEPVSLEQLVSIHREKCQVCGLDKIEQEMDFSKRDLKCNSCLAAASRKRLINVIRAAYLEGKTCIECKCANVRLQIAHYDPIDKVLNKFGRTIDPSDITNVRTLLQQIDPSISRPLCPRCHSWEHHLARTKELKEKPRHRKIVKMVHKSQTFDCERRACGICQPRENENAENASIAISKSILPYQIFACLTLIIAMLLPK